MWSYCRVLGGCRRLGARKRYPPCMLLVRVPHALLDIIDTHRPWGGHMHLGRTNYRGTLLIRTPPPMGPYNKTMPMALQWY